MLKQSKTVWVYKTKSGDFYKNHGKGSWAVRYDAIKRKDITTESIANATQFRIPCDSSPYLHRCMEGGKWVQIEITTSYEVVK